MRFKFRGPRLALSVLLLALTVLGPVAARAECGKLFKRLTAGVISAKQSKKLDEAVLQDFADLTKITPPDRAAATAWNYRVISALEKLPEPATKGSTKGSLSRTEIEEIWLEMKENRVVETTCEDFPNKYDPDKNVQIGFCFGRAIAAHLMARNHGLSNRSIRKVWLVGSMRGGGVNWSHHVATALRCDDGKWYVIDTHEMDGVVTLQQWLEEFRPPEKNKRTNSRLMLFATEPDRFGPSFTEPLYEATTAPDQYNGFFHDLFESTRREGQTVRQQIRDLSR